MAHAPVWCLLLCRISDPSVSDGPKPSVGNLCRPRPPAPDQCRGKLRPLQSHARWHRPRRAQSQSMPRGPARRQRGRWSKSAGWPRRTCCSGLYLVAVMNWFNRKVLACRIFQHIRGGVLCRGVHRGDATLRRTRYHEQRSGYPVHLFCLYWPHEACRCKNFYGRQATQHRQHLHRVSVSVVEIKVRFPVRQGNNLAGERRYRMLDDIL